MGLPAGTQIGQGCRKDTKILDFGLAKEQRLSMADSATDAVHLPGLTLKGTLLGTVGYMAPEQVRGEPADARSDIFALGVLLLEMLTGEQAFTGDSAVEVLHAILRDDPLEGRKFPSELRPLLERLLAKDPDQRFQSAKDLAFALEGWGRGPSLAKTETNHWRPWLVFAVIATLTLASGAWILGRGTSATSPITWTQITTRPTLIAAGRFAPDGRSLAYSAEGQDGRSNIFIYTEGEPFPCDTGQHGKVLALGKGGELFFAGRQKMATIPGQASAGTCLRWKGEGTEPRPWIADAQEADRSPDEQRIAIVVAPNNDYVSNQDTYFRLECPPGKVLARSPMVLACPRWSPDGRAIAFIQATDNFHYTSRIVVVDPEGRIRFQSPEINGVHTLAWAPDGRKVVFTRGDIRDTRTIWTIDLHGEMQQILSANGDLDLLDIDPRGRLLVASNAAVIHQTLEQGGRTQDLVLPFLQKRSADLCLSPDGSKAAFTALEEDGSWWIYVRDQATGKLTRATPGIHPIAFSADDQWLMVQRTDFPIRSDSQVTLVPLGSGREVPLQTKGLRTCEFGLLPDTAHPLVSASLPNGTFAWFLLDANQPPRRVARALKDHPFICPMVPAGNSTFFSFDLNQGLLQGTLEEKSWRAVGGILADRVPLGWDPRTGEILVTPRSDWSDRLASAQPITTITLERLNPRTMRLRKDRVLKAPHFLSRLCVGPNTAVFGWADYPGGVYIVNGALGR